MARVGQDRPVLHHLEVLPVENVDITGDSYEEVAHSCRLVHLQHAKAVHRRLEGFDRVDLGDHDVGAVTLRPRRQTASDPTVPRDDERFPGEEHVGRPDDAVDGRLSRAVTVVEHVLGVGLVHGHDRIGQDAVLRHRAKADHARRGFLGAADNLWELVPARLVEHGDEVGAVVHRQLRPVIEGRLDVLVVGLVVLAADRVGLDAVKGGQGRRHRIIRRERIGRAQGDLPTACFQREHQVGSLARHVQARRQPQPFERLVFREPLADQGEHRHLARGPVHQVLALRGEARILYVASP